MKRILSSMLLIGLFLCFAIRAKAVPIPTSFTLTSPLNSAGQIVTSQTAGTTVTANFSFTKVGETNNTIYVNLILVAGGTETIISSQAAVQGSGNWGNQVIWQSSVTGIIPAGKTSGDVYLAYSTYEGNNQGQVNTRSSVSYAIYNPNTTPSTPGNNPFPTGNLSMIKPYVSFASGYGTIARNGVYHLDFQADGNLVLYKDGAVNPVLWASDTNLPNTKLEFLGFGQVVIDDANGVVKWNSGILSSSTNSNCWWILQADGNFVGYQSYRLTSDGGVTPYGTVLGSTKTAGVAVVIVTEGFTKNINARLKR